MSGERERLHRLEGWMTYLRWVAGVGAAVTFSLRSYPSNTEQGLAWDLIVLFALGSLVVWGLNGRVMGEAEQRRLGTGAFIFDAIVAAAIVWLFAFEPERLTWVLILLIPLEGAFRFGIRGALRAGALTIAFLAAYCLRVASIYDEGFDAGFFAFAATMTAAIGLLAGGMAEHWRTESATAHARSDQLQEFDQMKDRFIAVTSHEIRGPVTAIIAGVDTVLKKGDRLSAEQNSSILGMVQQQGVQLSRLVDDLLVTSQLQTGTLALETGWAELEVAIREAIEASATKRRSHQLEVFVEPMECELDQARVGQIVRNLVENAYKYTPDDASVRVTGSRTPQGIVIEVADDGEGIPEEKRGQLFEAFARIEETAAGRDGVGLGLYVVSHLTSAMGGRIDLTSSSKGTAFRIDIPCNVRPLPHRKLGVIEGNA